VHSQVLEAMTMTWKLKAGYTADQHPADKHPTITESTSGVVACGDSWCDGRCDLPALVLSTTDEELRVFGSMVACGLVFQVFRRSWQGKKVEVTLSADVSIDRALKLYWL
jgi:hypothetical protein